MTRFALTVAVAVVAFFGSVPLSGCGKDNDEDNKTTPDEPANEPVKKTETPKPNTPPKKPNKGSVPANLMLAVTSGKHRLMLNSKDVRKDKKEFVFDKKTPKSVMIEKELKKYASYDAAIEVNSVNAGLKLRQEVYSGMKEQLIFRYSPVVVHKLKRRMTQLFTNEAAKAANVSDSWGAPVTNALRKLTPDDLETAIKTNAVPSDFPPEIDGEILHELFVTFKDGWAKLKNNKYKEVIKDMTEVINDGTKRASNAGFELAKEFTDMLSTETGKKQERQIGKIHSDVGESGNLSFFDILDSAFLYVGTDLLKKAVGTDAPKIYVSPDMELTNNDQSLEQIEKFDHLVSPEATKEKAGFAVLFLHENKCVAFMGIQSDSKYSGDSSKKEKSGLSKQVKNVMTFAKEKCAGGGVAYLMGDFGLLSNDTLKRFQDQCVAKLDDDALKETFTKTLKPVMDTTNLFYDECRQGTKEVLSPRTKSEEKDKVYEKSKPFEDYESLFTHTDWEDHKDSLRNIEVASDKTGVMVLPIHHSTFKSIDATAKKGDSDMMNNPVVKFDIEISPEKPRGGR